MEYRVNIIIKKKGENIPKQSACFSTFSYDNSPVTSSRIYIQVDESIKDPYKYVEFVNDCFGFKTCEYNDLKDSTFEYLGSEIKPIKRSSTGHYLEFYNFDEQFREYNKRTLLLLTFLRYLQEFPEVVTFLEANGYSWENLKKAHFNWRKIIVKYYNVCHMICSDPAKLCSLKKFRDNIKKSDLRYVYSYTS